MKNMLRNKFKVMRMLFIASIICILGILSILFFGEMRMMVRGQARICGWEEYSLRSMVNAKVVEIFRKDGDFVKKGEKILRFSSNNFDADIMQLENEIEELKISIELKKANIRFLKTDPLPAEYRHAENNYLQQAELLKIMQQRLDTYRALFKKNALSKEKLDNLEMDFINTKYNCLRSKRNYEKVRQNLDKKIISIAEQELKLMQAKLKNNIRELASHRKLAGNYLVTAPCNGIISDLKVKVSDYLRNGEYIANISSDNGKKCVAYISESNIFEVKVGQEVKIYSNIYDYLQYGTFSGKVVKISSLPEKIAGKVYYEVTCSIDNEKYTLKLGSGAQVKIIGDRTRIISYLLSRN